MNDTPSLLLKALRDDTASQALVGIAVDYLLALPLNRYLDLELILDTTREAYDPQALKELLMKVLPQGIERWHDISARDFEPLGEWLTPELDAELRALVMSARPLKAERVQRWVHHPLTRHVTRAFVEETLERFIQRVKPSGEGGGVLGAASRGAFGWAQKASRGVLGSVAEQLQGQLKSLTSDFVTASMGTLLDQLALIINTPEVARLLADAQLKSYMDITSRSVNDLMATANQEVPSLGEGRVHEWSELLAEWIEHLLAQPAVSDLVSELQEQLICDMGDKSIKELVGGEEPAQALRLALVKTLSPHLASVSETTEFQSWCQQNL